MATNLAFSSLYKVPNWAGGVAAYQNGQSYQRNFWSNKANKAEGRPSPAIGILLALALFLLGPDIRNSEKPY